jgi:hypothetical protein
LIGKAHPNSISATVTSVSRKRAGELPQSGSKAANGVRHPDVHYVSRPREAAAGQ